MPSQGYSKFLESMNIGYIQWHDGIGYDLGSLRELPEDELQAVTDILVSRNEKDWRDIEALDCIGSHRAIDEIASSLLSSNLSVRIEAAERLAKRKLLTYERIESIVIDSLGSTTLLNGMTKVLDFAAANATPSIIHKLLWCALNGNDDIRVHSAALAHFLLGQSSSTFDYSFRPLYLRFNSKNKKERQLALSELCRNTDVNLRFQQ